jgi:hypothetical protein
LASLFSLLFLSLPDVVRDVLVDPALRVFLILDALPQGLVWLLVLLVLGFLALKFFRVFGAGAPRNEKPGASSSLFLRDLVSLLRRSRYSPWARRAVRWRLARIAVALRMERELISPDRAWEEIREGRWPKDPVLSAFLRGEGGGNFLRELEEALDSLYRYAQGGEL